MARRTVLRRAFRLLVGIPALLALACPPAGAAPAATAAMAEPEVHIAVVGGLAGVGQYERFERPFWMQEVPQLTGGRVRADILPFDRSGIRGSEMLELMRLRVVPFGNVQLGLAAADDPELNAIDLPALSPGLEQLHETVARWRGQLEQHLAERYGLVLLAVYAYPPQVTFCREPFESILSLSGRKVRVSSVAQSELMAGLGAMPVVIPFAGIVDAVRNRVVDCAITGAMSGNVLGLHQVTRAISDFSVSWGVNFFAANRDAWEELAPDIQARLRLGLARLEAEIWSDVARQTSQGLLCNTGQAECQDGTRGALQLVEDKAATPEMRAQLLRELVLPGWVQRCGASCGAAWDNVMAGPTGVRLGR